jgi:hypothetical protein
MPDQHAAPEDQFGMHAASAVASERVGMHFADQIRQSCMTDRAG